MRVPIAALLLVQLLLPRATPASAQEYQLVWSDEFDGTSLDTAKWEAQIGTGCPDLCGWGNNELQYYRAQNASVGGGVLRISAKQESFAGSSYTSARLRTRFRGDWEYGRFEVRAKLPRGQGMWPAIWMLPTDNAYGGWAASGEIDIMELRGQEPAKVLGTIHYGGSFPSNTYSGGEITLPAGQPDFTEEFHVFTLEWTPCELRWFVDGQLFSTKTNWYSENGPYPAPFDERFHLLMNVAVGGNFVGAPNASTQFPQEMVVDYVRVYRKNDGTDCSLLFAGMDHGNPFGNGWFEFNGSVGGGGISADFSDLPPNDECRASLEASFGSGGAAGFYGGFGRRRVSDLTDMTHFSFWIHPDAGQQYALEINLQDDDNGDGIIPSTPDGADDEWQAVISVGGPGSDVLAGGGWQRVDLPFTDFVDDNSFHFGGNGVFDPFAGGNGELINVVWVVIGNGGPASFRTDNWKFTRQTASISGRVFDDSNGNGVDDGEPGLGSVAVDLFDLVSETVLASTMTNPNGDYAFGELLGGTYEVRIEPASIPGGRLPSVDPDGIDSPGVFLVDLACDALVAGQDLGFAPIATGAAALPHGPTLAQNVPNPFNPSTTIIYELLSDDAVVLDVQDVAGRRIRTLVSGRRSSGRHEVEWNGRDEAGQTVAGGVYYYSLRTSDEVQTRRMILLK